MKDSIGVLFVCTGNICRSPTAEAVFRHKARLAGLEPRFLIDSAGTHGYHIGEPPDSRSIATAMARGVDMRDLRARIVASGDFDQFDYVLAMDRGHRGLLLPWHVGASRGQLGLFLGFPDFTGGGGDVPDPYYGAQKDFDDVYVMIERGCDTMLSWIRQQHGF